MTATDVFHRRGSGAAFVLFLLVIFLAPTAGSTAQSGSLVLRNVTLIDGTGSAAQPGTSVVITGNRITAVGRSAAVPPGAQVVDATGKFLIPGLWDMHLHLRAESGIPQFSTYGEVLLIANGVTGARVMAGLPRFHSIKRAIEAGTAVGPRMEISSRNMDGLIPSQRLPPKLGDIAAEDEEWRSVGTGEIPRAYQITNAAQARAAVAEARAGGVEFLKIHMN